MYTPSLRMPVRLCSEMWVMHVPFYNALLHHLRRLASGGNTLACDLLLFLSLIQSGKHRDKCCCGVKASIQEAVMGALLWRVWFAKKTKNLAHLKASEDKHLEKKKKTTLRIQESCLGPANKVGQLKWESWQHSHKADREGRSNQGEGEAEEAVNKGAVNKRKNKINKQTKKCRKINSYKSFCFIIIPFFLQTI